MNEQDKAKEEYWDNRREEELWHRRAKAHARGEKLWEDERRDREEMHAILGEDSPPSNVDAIRAVVFGLFFCMVVFIVIEILKGLH